MDCEKLIYKIYYDKDNLNYEEWEHINKCEICRYELNISNLIEEAILKAEVENVDFKKERIIYSIYFLEKFKIWHGILIFVLITYSLIIIQTTNFKYILNHNLQIFMVILLVQLLIVMMFVISYKLFIQKYKIFRNFFVEFEEWIHSFQKK